MRIGGFALAKAGFVTAVFLLVGAGFTPATAATPATPSTAPTSTKAQGDSGFPAKADAQFTGTYAVSVQKPQRRGTQQMGEILFGGPSQQLQGSLRIDMRMVGEALTARISGNGGLRPETLTGLVRGGVCRLTDARQTVVYEGRCGRSGFSGSIRSTEAATSKLKGQFQTTMLSLSDGAERERQQELSVQKQREARQDDKVRAARNFLALKARAEAGEAIAMRQLADAYADGWGTRPDAAAAELWWGKALAKGDGWSAYQLGSTTIDRAFDTKSQDLARKALGLFERCARSNPADMPELKSGAPAVAACEHMTGLILAMGVLGMSKDIPAARRWFSACAKRGMPECSDKLRQLP